MTMSLTKAIIRARGIHEIVLCVNNSFPDSINQIESEMSEFHPHVSILEFRIAGPAKASASGNLWRNQAAELTYQKFLSDAGADAILIPSLFEGENDEAITAIKGLANHIPTAIILHDLIPLIQSEKFFSNKKFESWYKRKLNLLTKADLLLAVSNSTKTEARDLLAVPAHKIEVISAGANVNSGEAGKTSTLDTLRRLNIPEHFILSVGAIEERKNIGGLIAAYAALPRHLIKNYPLVLVGKGEPHVVNFLEVIARKNGLAQKNVIFTKHIPDADLFNLYSTCDLFVFPSFHEGFGLPALEAMACGAPTIGSNISSIPEVIGSPSALFAPGSKDDMAKTIERALINQEFRNFLKSHGATQAQLFSWEASATRTIEALEKLVGQRSIPHKRISIEEFSDKIAAINASPAPNDTDIKQLARSLDQNEKILLNFQTFK